MHDLVLAILHHLLFLGLIVMLASELALLRTAEPPVKRLAGLDAGYGHGPADRSGRCRTGYGRQGLGLL